MKRIAFVSTTVAVAALARGALAADPDDVASLLNEPIVTTATKTPQSESTTPGISTVLTADDMRRYGIRTLAEAIDFLTLGAVTSHSSSPDVGVRGIAITGAPGDILVLIDGHAVNEPVQGSAEIGWGAGIPLELVDHVEMILGPGAVLYGTNAMLGVIQVVTKRAKDFAGMHAFADTSFVSDGRVGAGAGYEFVLFGSPSEITAAVQYFRQDGPNLTMPLENTGIDPATGRPESYSRFGLPTGIWGGTASRSNNAEAPSALVRFTTGRLAVELNAASFSRGLPDAPTSFDDPLNRHAERRLSVDAVYRIPVSNVVEASIHGVGVAGAGRRADGGDRRR